MPRLRSNESPSGAFKRQSGLAQARWRGLAPTSSGLFQTAVCPKPYQKKDRITKVTTVKVPLGRKDTNMKYDARACKFNIDTGCMELLHRGRGCTGCDYGAADGTGLPYL